MVSHHLGQTQSFDYVNKTLVVILIYIKVQRQIDNTCTQILTCACTYEYKHMHVLSLSLMCAHTHFCNQTCSHIT